MPDLLSVQEALERMLKRFLPVSTTTVPLELSLGMVLAEDIVSTIDQPPFTNSGMDGFAVKAADTAGAIARPAGAPASRDGYPGRVRRARTASARARPPGS